METAIGVALIVTAIATVATGAATVVLAFAVFQAIKDIRAKIETNNGLTVGEMVQHNYSMAAQEVPTADRTAEQDSAVAMLTDQEHSTHADKLARTDETLPSTPPGSLA